MTEDVKCPKCGSETVVHTVVKGPNIGRKFHVCARYPECKGRVPIKRSSAPRKSISKLIIGIILFIWGLGGLIANAVLLGFHRNSPNISYSLIIINSLVCILFMWGGYALFRSWKGNKRTKVNKPEPSEEDQLL